MRTILCLLEARNQIEAAGASERAQACRERGKARIDTVRPGALADSARLEVDALHLGFARLSLDVGPDLHHVQLACLDHAEEHVVGRCALLVDHEALTCRCRPHPAQRPPNALALFTLCFDAAL